MNIDRQSQFVSLLVEHQSTLRAYVLSHFPGSPDASDVIQQANLILWKKRENFKLGTNFRAWMFAIAHFEVMKYRKKLAQRKFPQFDEDLSQLLTNLCAPEPVEIEDRVLALEYCLSKLSDKSRRLIEQRYVRTEPLAEYAAKIGESAAAMRVSLHRIRTALRKCINFRLKHEPGENSQ